MDALRRTLERISTSRPVLRELISGRPSEPAILEAANAKGFESLWVDGVEKITAGETTPREILRVAPRSEEVS